jgi:hypothetical protein
MKPLYRLALPSCIILSLILIGCSKHPTTPFAVEAMFPTSGPDSTQVSIGGSGFSTTLADDLVSFNGNPATVLSATSTALVVRTPTLAGTGNVTVSVGGKTLTAGVFAYDTTWMGTTISDTITYPEYLSIDDHALIPIYHFRTSGTCKLVGRSPGLANGRPSTCLLPLKSMSRKI